jgi:diguanylate cyclase (GGDEF)-like protein/PAS domain S-box-containing protein
MNRVYLWFLIAFNALVLAAVVLKAAPSTWPVWALAVAINVVAGLLLSRSRGQSSAVTGAREVEWPAALCEVDARGKVSNLNGAAREMFGLSEGDEPLLSQLTHPDEAGRNEELMRSLLDGRARKVTQDRRCFKRDGTMFPALWHLRPAPALPGSGAALRAAILIEDTSRRAELELHLERTRSSLHELHRVVAAHSLEDQCAALLDLGRHRFGVETALLSQSAEDRVRLIEVRSDDERLRRGTSFSLREAKHDGLLVRPLGPRGLLHADFEKAEADAGCGAPAPAPQFLCEGETYLGTPIVVGGRVWGGLHFSDAEPRPQIEDEDKEFLEVMAAWLSGEIERRQSRRLLEEQQEEILKAAIQLENLAVHDGLTGAKNRRAFDEHLEAEWQRARRYKTPLSLVLLDVDKFKLYNDSFGHPAGDAVLKKVAQVLSDSVRNIDFVARYGGEEFVLLLPNTDCAGAMVLAERLRERIEQVHWTLRPVTASFGVATLDERANAPAGLLQAADEALYASKEAGRNRVTHAQDALAHATGD